MLLHSMKIEAMLDIMIEEGVDAAEGMEETFIGTSPSQGWIREVEEIYDRSKINNAFRESFEQALAGTDVADAVAYFDAPTGQKIIELELSARAALLDEDIAKTSEAALAEAQDRNDPRLVTLARYIEENDLIERNVEGALNSNYAFMVGLESAQPNKDRMDEADLLRFVWGRETEIREDTDKWLNSFLLLAYDPLTDEELEGYIEFSSTQAGRAVNSALFIAYSAVFDPIWNDLGQAIGRRIGGSDI